jgi:hypothetical protein
MTSNLTPLQQGLVTDLIKEFNRINPKPKAEGSKRFTLETIDECNREEQRFKDTITKHNLTMMKVFTNQFNEELKEFKKEFGKVLTTQIGRDSHGKPYATLDKLTEMTKEKPLANNESYEMELYIVSKTKSFSGSDSRENYCDNMRYLQLYVDFKRERVVHNLESGKAVVVYKIVGLEYRRTFSYLYKDKTLNTSTLDELIQQSKDVQKIFVELVG